MNKEDYNARCLELDVRRFKVNQRQCEVEAKMARLRSEADLLEGELANLETLRLQVEIDWAKARLNGEAGYEDMS